MTDDRLEVPKPNPGDIAYALIKAGLSVIPVAGGPAAELFQYLVQPPLEKRREEWMAQVGEKLQELAAEGLDLEELSSNVEFVSAVMHATHIALRTHRDEKLVALRNAIINVAIHQAPEEAVQHLFLTFVDSFTQLHLQILNVFQAPTAPPGMSMGALSHVLEYNIPELRGRKELYEQFWRDLFLRGLVNTERLNTGVSGIDIVHQRLTSLGQEFMKFVSEPNNA